MATLQEAIQQAQQNPNTDFATELRRRIEGGKFDEQIKQEEIELPGYTPAPTFLEGVAEAGKERAELVMETAEEQAAGNITFAEGVIRQSGEVAGFATDVLGEAIAGAYRVVGQPLKEEATAMFVESGAADVVVKGLDSWNEWKQINPRKAEVIEAGINIADLATAGLVGKAAKEIGEAAIVEAGKGVTMIGKETIAAGKVIGAETPEAVKSGISQVTGLTPDTIETIVKKPDAFSQAEAKGIDIAREDLAGKVDASIKSRLKDLSETGKEYGTIRESGIVIESPIFEKVLENKGIKIIDGELDFSDTNIGDLGDMNAIKRAYDFVKDKPQFTAGDVLNTRGKLDDTINFNAQVTSKGDAVVRDLRRALDNIAKDKITGLKELDAKFAPEITLLRKLQKDFLNKDGTLKDNAISKIANLVNKGNELKLKRVQQLIPEIADDIKAVKALQDVELAKGQKVGAYAKGALIGGLGGFVLGGPLGALVGAILTSPNVIVRLLRGASKAFNLSDEAINTIETKIKSGTKLNKEESEVVSKVIQGDKEGIVAKEIETPEIKLQETKPTIKETFNPIKHETSVLQIIDLNTGAREFKIIEKGQLDEFNEAVDVNIAGEAIDGKVYHLTAFNPEEGFGKFVNAGFKLTGNANIAEIPTKQIRID